MHPHHQTISEATGYTDPRHLDLIEDCLMRIVLHTRTLDWAPKETIANAAKIAVRVLHGEAVALA